MLLKQLEFHVIRTAGTGPVVQALIEVPVNSHRVKWFARHLTSIPVVHRLNPEFDANTISGNFNVTGSAIFDISGTAIGTTTQGEITSVLACNHLQWVVQANAGANTAFFLRVKFFDV